MLSRNTALKLCRALLRRLATFLLPPPLRVRFRKCGRCDDGRVELRDRAGVIRPSMYRPAAALDALMLTW
jgi:hypothetical protein